jgi:gamma-glutamyltranspeptidase/glutathione hydrolase
MTYTLRSALRVGVLLLLAATVLQGARQRPANKELATFPSEWTHRPGASAPTSPNGMVVSNCPLATQAGVEILRAGGNAVDAAVAVGFALAVAYPEAGNLGGGGYAVVGLAGGRTAAIDFRETAPSAATRDMFAGPGGRPTDQSLVGHRASGVPGSVAGLLALLDRHGTMPRTRVIAPAFRLASGGFEVDEVLHASIAQNGDLIRRFAGAPVFLPAGRPAAVGSRLVQPDLAKTLQAIALDGAAGFYKGPVAAAVAAEMKRGGGLVTAADLASYAPAWRTPIEGRYRGHGILAMPPSSSGGATVIEALNILETWRQLARWNSAEALHRLSSAFQLAFIDRNRSLGDPAFVEVPLDRLTSKAYARRLRGRIQPGRWTPTDRLQAWPRKPGTPSGRTDGPPREDDAPNPTPREGLETTNYAVVDRLGNAVAVTTTINSLYGSGVWVPGAGFFLNNEMDDFAVQPGTPNQFGLVQGEANAVAPGKRMLSAMAPTIVTDDRGRVELIVGGRGGPRIITAVVQAIVNVIDYRMSLADAMGAPRIHHQALPDVLDYEKGGVPASVVAALQAMGHKTQPAGTGSLTGIRRTPKGWEGMFDPRKHGLAAGY